MPALKNRALIVLGMHRSGTSAFSGVLNLLGVDLGAHLLPASNTNQSGYWEHEEIVAVHDRLLMALGSSWDDPSPLPPNWWNSEPGRAVPRQAPGHPGARFRGLHALGSKRSAPVQADAALDFAAGRNGMRPRLDSPGAASGGKHPLAGNARRLRPPEVGVAVAAIHAGSRAGDPGNKPGADYLRRAAKGLAGNAGPGATGGRTAVAGFNGSRRKDDSRIPGSWETPPSRAGDGGVVPMDAGRLRGHGRGSSRRRGDPAKPSGECGSRLRDGECLVLALYPQPRRRAWRPGSAK